MASRRIDYSLAVATLLIVAVPRLLEGIPWDIPFPNSVQMLLYNDQEVAFHPSTGTIGFFLPGSIHSYFPLSYVFSRVFFVLVPSPILVEFISPLIVTFPLLLGLGRLWLRESVGIGWYTSLLAFATFSLFFTINGISSNPFLWFGTVGLWELIVFLTLLTLEESKAQWLLLFVVIVAMALGQDLLTGVSALLFLLIQALYFAQRRKFYLGWSLVVTMILFGYEIVIGIGGIIYYSRYLPTLEAQVVNFLNFNLRSELSVVQSHLSVLPLFQLVSLDVSFVILSFLFPVVLGILYVRNHVSPRNLILPGLILFLGDILRVESTTTAVAVASAFTIVLYIAFPLSIIGLARKVSTNGTNIGKDPKVRYSFLALAAIFTCVLILSSFSYNPILGTGEVHAITDPRLWFGYTQAAGVVIHQFAPAPIAVEWLTDTSILFVGSPLTISNFMLLSPIPAVSTPPNFMNDDILFSNGPLLLVMTS